MGLTLQQVFATLQSWRDGTVKNPTEVTATQLGGMSSSDIDKLFAGKVSSDETCLTIVGDQSFLPINVGGSFEGGAVGYHGAVSYMETDGRVYMLRCGSDGRKNGVYYVELEFDTDGVLSNHTPTTIEYRPSFIPAGWHITTVNSGYNDQIFGQISDGKGNYKTYLAYTKYTLDSTNHTGYIIDQFNDTNAFIFEYKGTIYFVAFTSGSPVAYIVSSLATTNLSGAPAQVTGWTGKGIAQKTYSNVAGLHLADMGGSTNAADAAYCQYTPGMAGISVFISWPRLEVYDIDANNLRFLFGHECWADGGNGLGGARIFVCRQIEVNIAAKTYTLHANYDNKVLATFVNGVTSIVTNDDANYSRYRWDGGWAGNWKTMTCISPNGYLLTYNVSNNYVTDFYAKKNYVVNSHKNLDSRNVADKYVLQAYKPLYGSAVGGAIYSPNVYDSNNICCRSNSDAIIRSNAANWNITDNITLPSGVTVNSLTLNSDREVISTGDYILPCKTVVEIVNDVVYRSTSIFYTGHLTGSTSATLKSETGSPVSITQAQWDRIHADGVSILQTVYGALQKPTSVLVVPQQSATPPFVLTYGIAPDKNIYQCRRTLSFNNVKSGALPSPTVVNEMHTIIRDSGQNTDIGIGFPWGASAITIADYSGFQVQSGCGPVRATWTGNGGGLGSLWIVKGTVANNISNNTSQDHQGGAYALPMPKLGVVFFSTGNDAGVQYTNMSGRILGKVEADIRDTANWGNKPEVIFMTNAVVGGWFVYVNERHPATINGHSGTTEAATIDLRTITTSYTNHTFYVYVRWVGGDKPFEFQIQPGALGAAMSPDIVYVGTITTNGVGIESINIEKVVGIAGFNISSIRRGRTIPVTTGAPNETGSLTW